MKSLTKLEMAIIRLESDLQASKSELKKFTENFEQNPVHALSLSKDVFRSAARFEVCSWVLNNLREEKKSFECVFEYYKQRVLRDARSIASSSSMPSNIMEEVLKVEVARFVEEYAYYKDAK